MDISLFKQFMEKIVTYHFEFKTSKENLNDQVRDHDALTEALQFVERLETDNVPFNFKYSPTGELVLKWKNENTEFEKSRIFQLAFHQNKDITCSKFKLGEETISKIVVFQDNSDYYKQQKELEVDMLNFLEGDIGTHAFSNY